MRCWALAVYGNKHFAPEGTVFQIVDAVTGALAEPMLIDRHSGRPLGDPGFKVVHVPAASAGSKAGAAPAEGQTGTEAVRQLDSA